MAPYNLTAVIQAPRSQIWKDVIYTSFKAIIVTVAAKLKDNIPSEILAHKLEHTTRM